jgi:hypothetical protein
MFKFAQPDRKGAHQFDTDRQIAGLQQNRELGGEVSAESRNLPQAIARKVSDRDRKIAHSAGSVTIGADAKKVLAADFEHIGYVVENPGDFLVLHHSCVAEGSIDNPRADGPVKCPTRILRALDGAMQSRTDGAARRDRGVAIVSAMVTRIPKQRAGQPACFVEPMQCLAAAELPEGPNWEYEIKFDGYRALGIKSGGRAVSRPTRWRNVAG